MAQQQRRGLPDGKRPRSGSRPVYEPPSGAHTRFATNGIEVVSIYALVVAGAGSRLTQSVEAKPSGLTARLLVPVLQPRLEEKLTQDLERLRETLGG